MASRTICESAMGCKNHKKCGAPNAEKPKILEESEIEVPSTGRKKGNTGRLD
ncbi:MAG: hypothetical protein ACXAC5_02885 [Promethearchaeota archaeon]